MRAPKREECRPKIGLLSVRELANKVPSKRGRFGSNERRWSNGTARLSLEIDMRERMFVVVTNNEASGRFFN